MSAVVVLSVTIVLAWVCRVGTRGEQLLPALNTLDRAHRVLASPGHHWVARLDHATVLFHHAVGNRSTSARPGAPRLRSGKDPIHAHRAHIGADVHTPWYIRVRAAVILIVMIAGLGLALALALLLVVAAGRVLLETLAG